MGHSIWIHKSRIAGAGVIFLSALLGAGQALGQGQNDTFSPGSKGSSPDECKIGH